MGVADHGLELHAGQWTFIPRGRWCVWWLFRLYFSFRLFWAEAFVPSATILHARIHSVTQPNNSHLTYINLTPRREKCFDQNDPPHYGVMFQKPFLGKWPLPLSLNSPRGLLNKNSGWNNSQEWYICGGYGLPFLRQGTARSGNSLWCWCRSRWTRVTSWTTTLLKVCFLPVDTTSVPLGLL